MPKASTTTFLPDQSWLAIVCSLGLSDREAQIAQLLLGPDNREDVIAGMLAISPHTVHTHLERLYRKLGVTSRCQVVARLFQRYVELAPNGSHTYRGIRDTADIARLVGSADGAFTRRLPAAGSLKRSTIRRGDKRC
jgi:DNA-binding CsgD family transcriptional regulator